MVGFRKILYILLLSVFLFCYKSSIISGEVSAQTTPTPTPTPIPTCSATRNDEWHSLRPYPFDPCNPYPEDLAPYCANSIIAWDDITKIYHIGDYIAQICSQGTIPDCDCGGSFSPACCNMVLDGNGEFTTGMIECIFKENGQRQISASFENAELPIMGNTVNVVRNHVGADDVGFNDAAKVNEYVSWYLNGVIGRAEYPYPDLTKINAVTSMENPDDLDKIINFSGPIKKLLPFSIQNQERINQIDDLASNTVRHDQMVACTHLWAAEITLPFIGTILIPSSFVPIECYGTFFNFAHRRNLSDWKGNTPPIEENGTYLYQDQIEFIKDYTKWRGLICLYLPIKIPLLPPFNPLERVIFYCIDNPFPNIFSPNVWSELFSYIPFSSTEDRVGDVHLKSVIVNEASPDFRLLNVSVDADNAELYFPHMQESTELASLLQKTYASKDVDLTGPVSRVYNSSNPYCDLTEVRSNPGDPISDPNNPATLDVTVNYEAEIYCDFYVGTGDFNGVFCETPTTADPPGVGGQCNYINRDNPIYCDTYYSRLDCSSGSNTCTLNCQAPPTDIGCSRYAGYSCMPRNWGCTIVNPDDTVVPLCRNNALYGCYFTGSCTLNPPYSSDPVQQCTKTLNVNIQPETETPLADEVWSQLVAGPAGVFKRIFPEVVAGAPVESIWDVPGASTYTFDCNGANCSIGAPSGNRSASELYFPHIGGIHEYFLRAIQTALRPKGFGNPILSRTGTGLPGQPGICNYNDQTISAAIDAAASKYGVPSSMLRAIFEIEAYEYIADPINYTCEENYAGAAGLTQITRGAYQQVTCSNERYDNGSDIGVCTSEGGKLSRCDVNDAFELAARTLLWKAGRWSGCNQTGPFPTTVPEQYAPVCAYYGSCRADSLTNQYNYNLPSGQCSPQNYCDIVFNKMGRGRCSYSYYCPYP
jgi:hypothetical protein